MRWDGRAAKILTSIGGEKPEDETDLDGVMALPPAIRELRSLTRQRRDLIAAGARERNRVQRLLEEANIKLRNVLSDVFGVSGQRMLASVGGKRQPGRSAPAGR